MCGLVCERTLISKNEFGKRFIFSLFFFFLKFENVALFWKTRLLSHCD